MSLARLCARVGLLKYSCSDHSFKLWYSPLHPPHLADSSVLNRLLSYFKVKSFEALDSVFNCLTETERHYVFRILHESAFVHGELLIKLSVQKEEAQSRVPVLDDVVS